MKRNHFIKLMGYTCVGASLPAFISGCAATHYVSASREGNKLGVDRSEFTFEKNGVQEVRSFIVIESVSLQFPIALYQADDTFLAFSTECTHQGCEIKPRATLLTCPCHGSEFATSGKVLEGPAELPLKSYEVSTNSQMIYVHI